MLCNERYSSKAIQSSELMGGSSLQYGGWYIRHVVVCYRMVGLGQSCRVSQSTPSKCVCANERVVAAERSFSQLERLKSFSGVEREEAKKGKATL